MVIDMKFHEIELGNAEERYMLKALKNGHITGRGPNTRIVEGVLENFFPKKSVLMTTSGTHALEMAVHLVGIKEHDEVIMPSFTFPSTANAVLAMGGVPVFVPVEHASLCISLKTILPYITKKTKAVIAVHYGGVCHDIDLISAYCSENNIKLIEDAAQAFGSVYNGISLGSYGDVGCLSFHGTKNDVSGEGGAIILPEADDSLRALAERILEKGTDRMAFMRGDKAKYEWTGYGSSYVPSDILMALLRGQLESFEQRMEKRRQIISAYIRQIPRNPDKYEIFEGMEDDYKLNQLGSGLDSNKSNGHLFYIRFHNKEDGVTFKQGMQKKCIPIRQHFVPLHISKMGKTLGYSPNDFPFEKDLFDRIFRLPVHTKLSKQDVDTVIAVVKRVLEDL